MSTVKMARGKAAREHTEQSNGGGVPALWTPEALIKHSAECGSSSDGGKTWVPARGLGFQGLCFTQRLKLAWGVFTGRYDALKWPTTRS